MRIQRLVDRSTSLIVGVVLLLSVLGASKCNDGGEVATELTILHTNDIHSHYKAAATHSEQNPYNLGGLARIKTLADQIRASRPNTIMLDAGDWSEGQIYYTLDAGANTLQLFDKIGYDAVVVGNHDFLNGPVELAARIERAAARFPVLGANKNLALVDERDRVNKAVRDYTIIKKGGLRIAVIGLLTEEYVYYPFFKPATITSAFEKASEISKKIRNENLADVTILLSHNNFKNNTELAKTVPFINVVVSGHSHAKTPKAVEVKNGGQPVYLVEAGEWGQFLGDLTLLVDKKKRTVKLKSYALRPVTADIAEHAGVAAMIEKLDQAVIAKYGRDITNDHVADCDHEMPIVRSYESSLGNLVADAYRASANTNMGMEEALLINMGLLSGSMSTMDMYNVLPHIYSPLPDRSQPFPEFGRAWTIKKLTIKGSSLRSLLNLTMLADAIGLPLGWVHISGGEITYTVKNGGATPIRTFNILDPNTGAYEPIVANNMYTIAVHDALYLGLRIIVDKLRLNIDLSHVEDTNVQTWEAIASYVSGKTLLKIAEHAPGNRYRAVEPDLAVYHHTMKILPGANSKSYKISVKIRNDGLAASQAGFKLNLLRSGVNDPVNDGLDLKTKIASDKALPPLVPGQSVTFEIPWSNVPAGIYNIKAEILGDDGQRDNNTAALHYEAR